MEAVENLMSEHRLIERVIDALVAFAGESSRKTSDDRAELAAFVTFIREFADGVHHGKEEEVLFAAMIEAGFPREAGPVGVMLAEHAEGRRLVGLLRGLSTQASPWSPAERQLIVEAANGYAGLLRSHIRKEDAILYPMAEQRVAPAAQARVDALCAELDRSQAARIEELLALADRLVQTHAPHAVPSAPPAFACGR